MAEPLEEPKREVLFTVLRGDQHVGKTSIITRFRDDAFEEEYWPTNSLDFTGTNMDNIRVQFWDLDEDRRYKNQRPACIRMSRVAIVVYDVTDCDTLRHATKWVKGVRELCRPDVIIILVGNKIDLEEERVVPTKDGKQRARELGVLFMEVSAKTGQNIEELFLTAATVSGLGLTPQLQ